MSFRKTRAALATVAILVGFSTCVRAQSTRTQLQNYNDQNISANGRGLITGPIANSMNSLFISSFGALNDGNTWLGSNYFSVNPIFSGCTGYLFATPTAPVTCNNTATGTGELVLQTSPTLITPALGTPSSVTLTNATGLPLSGLGTGFGTGVLTALGQATGGASGLAAYDSGGNLSVPGAIAGSQTIAGSFAGSVDFNSMRINDTEQITGANFGNGLNVTDVLGSNYKGGRQATLSAIIIQGSPATGNGNANYAAGVQEIIATANLLGTGTTFSTSSGAVFASNPFADAKSGATNLLELAGGEVDVELEAGATAAYKFGWSVAALSDDARHGSQLDAGYELRSATGAVGFNYGFLFDDLQGFGKFPVPTTGTLMGATVGGATTVANGIDFSAMTFSSYFIKSANAAISGAGVIQGTAYQVNATAGVTCAAGVPTSSFVVTSGIVTHC